MKEIKLTRGYVAVVDDEDYEYLNQFKWYAYRTHHLCYAKRASLINGVKTQISMHRELLNADPNLLVDHKDGNGLNNQKINLRLCTHSQNSQNSRSFRGTSKFKGVYSTKRGMKTIWHAQICVDRKQINIGSFMSEYSAASAYDREARKYFGEFARTNFYDKYANPICSNSFDKINK